VNADSIEHVGNLEDGWGNVHNKDLYDGECEKADSDEECDAKTRRS
jgi:hypothetical protein